MQETPIKVELYVSSVHAFRFERSRVNRQKDRARRKKESCQVGNPLSRPRSTNTAIDIGKKKKSRSKASLPFPSFQLP